ncbi:MAG: NmrA/HSCARG family protein [Gemmatimonadetes bacterium]|nr:NmrA/HSCARG family protein [Gemmatimonadota bacterium]
MPEQRRILVTGATGRQGGSVARHLLAAGFPVRALARNPSKPAAVALEQQGAQVVQGDMENPSSLDAAMVGMHGVYSVQNYWEKGVGYDGEIRQGRNLANAAKKAGVAHYVQASVAAAATAPDVEHFACKAEIDAYLDELELPHTVLGEVFYMENFLDPKNGPMLFPFLAGVIDPRTRLHMISVDDIGAIATTVFRHPERYIGKTLDIAGDVLTINEMRLAYRKIVEKRAKGWAVPGFVVRWMNRQIWRQLRWNNDPGWQFGLGEAMALNPAMTSFEDFLRKHQITNL